MNDEFKLDPICGDDKNHQDGLEEAYGNLYKSLGVEPGLLSKSSIGRKIEQKYHDDGIDAQVYALSVMQNMNNDKKDYNAEYLKQSPLAGTISHRDTGDDIIELFGHKLYVREDNDDHINKYGKIEPLKKSLMDILTEYRIQNSLSDEDMAKQIQEYCEKYLKPYYIGRD